MSDTMLAPFANEPILELRRADERDRLAAALGELDSKLPVTATILLADGEGHGTGEMVSVDPAAPSRVVATAREAGPGDVDDAVAGALAAQRSWAERPVAERAQVLVDAAAALRARRLELAALILREVGKPWPEADADVCEAIDFLEYYARGALALDRGVELLQVRGERNELRHAPRGVVAVVAPWNFPLAIPCGMTAAALAAGNSVVLKPAEQAPGCAAALVESLHQAGVPRGALSLLPGAGEVGAALVRHRDVAAVAFTGSVPVGLDILEACARPLPGQRHLKRVIAEMGGKNCVIVDSDADLDDAVPAIVASAFGYAGQKCSAASRVLVHAASHDKLVQRLAGAVGVVQVGGPEHFATQVGPVIERSAVERLEHLRAEACSSGHLAALREAPGGDGFFSPVAVVTGVALDSEVLRTEIFGPLVTVESVSSIDEALARVDELPYALTGGLFSRNPRTVAHVTRHTPVGNLYVNRAITGAMVARQPFGGNRLSGTGSKAGGPGYLLEFTEPRVVTENTMRHGLVV